MLPCLVYRTAIIRLKKVDMNISEYMSQPILLSGTKTVKSLQLCGLAGLQLAVYLSLEV